MEEYNYSLYYNQIEEVVASINSKANELDQKIDRIDTIANALEEVWKGSDAEQYVTNILAFKPKIKLLVSTYKEAMAKLQVQADLMKDSQNQNLANIENLQV